MELNFDRLVFDQEPCRLLFTSQPYPVLLKTGFTVAADVIHIKNGKKTERSIIIAARSLAENLKYLIIDNSNSLVGIEVWMYKSGPEKTSSYVIEA